MRSVVEILMLLAISQICFGASNIDFSEQPHIDAIQQEQLIQQFTQDRVAFTQNLGQWDDQVLFRTDINGAFIWFCQDRVVYQFWRRISDPSHDGAGDPMQSPGRFTSLSATADGDQAPAFEQMVITAKFIGANSAANASGESLMEYKCNYFFGNDPDKWTTEVPNYGAMVMEEIYPGIDLRFSGTNAGELAYEFVASPGADLNQVRVEYEGADAVSLDGTGKLIASTEWGDVSGLVTAPVNGAGINSPESPLSSWSTTSDQTRGGASPAAVTLAYSTYLGGALDDWAFHIAVDSSGNAYITGRTTSSDFPTQNPYQTDQVDDDAYVTKLSSAGNSLIYSTYLGGGDGDGGAGITVDASGNAYITGTTRSTDFPTQNPYQTYQGGSFPQDAFVTKLSSSGNSLVYSTYLGGAGGDYGIDIALNSLGNAFVAGYTGSGSFPIQNAYQNFNAGLFDVFVTQLTIPGNGVVYSTFLGGTEWDYARSIAVDGSGNAYVTGKTDSPDFPIQNAYQATYQGGFDHGDAFVTKLSSSGSGLVYSTYLGGGDDDWGFDIDLDGSENVYVAGLTTSSDFPTQNPYQTHQGLYDLFVTKLSSSGSNLIYSTYLGGSLNDYGYALAVQEDGHAYVTGTTFSSDYPIQNHYQTPQSNGDVMVTKLSRAGSSMIYSTGIGGSGWDQGNVVVVDLSGTAYVAGWTYSADYPTQNPYQTVQGSVDVIVTKLNAMEFPCGDADGNLAISINDAVYIINYIFGGGPAPNPLEAADADCNGSVSVGDGVYIINFIFGGGPAPCAACP